MLDSHSSLSAVPISIIYAGGTISSLVTKKGYREGGHRVDLLALLKQHSPQFTNHMSVVHSSFAYLGLSENIDATFLAQIEESIRAALAESSRAVIVTYGTDSMEHAARHLQRQLLSTLTKTQKTVILTGSNHDLAHPRTDAWQNLRFALQSASEKVSPGVYVAFHDQLVPADKVVKEPFDGIEMNFISIDSERYRQLEQQQKRRDAAMLHQFVSRPEKAMPAAVIDYPVNRILMDHQELLAQINSKSRAVLLTLYHSGTANTKNQNTSVSELVKNLRKEKDLVFFGVSENGEAIDLHLYDTSVELRKAGVVPLYNMSKEVALLKLQMVSQLPPAKMIREMLTDWYGEITIPVITADIEQLIKLYA